MTVQERFAQDWGIDIDRVHKIVRYAKECGALNEKACNGDPHPANRLKPEDKNENSKLWGHALDISTAELLRLAHQYGFSEVVYTGLYPTLKRGERFVEIPY